MHKNFQNSGRKCAQMNVNKPNISAVVLEIASGNLIFNENPSIFQLLYNETNSQHVEHSKNPSLNVKMIYPGNIMYDTFLVLLSKMCTFFFFFKDFQIIQIRSSFKHQSNVLYLLSFRITGNYQLKLHILKLQTNGLCVSNTLEI